MHFDKVLQMQQWVHRQEKFLLDKCFVAAEQAILSHNLLTHKTLNTYRTTMSCVIAAEWSKAFDTTKTQEAESEQLFSGQNRFNLQ